MAQWRRAMHAERRRPFRTMMVVVAVLVGLSAAVEIAVGQEQPDLGLFTQGQTAFRERRLTEAVERFKALVEQHPQSSLRDLAYFWLSRSYLELGQVSEAEAVVKRLRQEFPASPLVTRATEILERTRVQKPVGPTAPGESAAKTAPVAPPPAGLPASPSLPVPAAPVPSVPAVPPVAVPPLAVVTPPVAVPLPAAPATPVPPVAAAPPVAPPPVVAKETPPPAPAPAAPVPPVTPSPVVAKEKPSPPAPSDKGAAPPPPPFLTVAPRADVRVTTKSPEIVGYPGEESIFPFSLTNAGNAKESFTVESTLSPDYEPAFFLDEGGSNRPNPGARPITATTPLDVNQSLQALLRLRAPVTMMNGEKRGFTVRVASASEPNTVQALNGTLSATGPDLRGEAKAAVERARPGDTVVYTLTVTNDGKAEARNVKVQLTVHPSLVFVTASPKATVEERETRKLAWGLETIAPAGAKKIELTFTVAPDALAGEEIIVRGEAQSTLPGRLLTFKTPSVMVQKVVAVQVAQSSTDELRVTPGDALFLPLTIRNLGNSPQAFTIKTDGVPAGAGAVVTETPVLGINEMFRVLLAVKIPLAKADGERLEVGLTAAAKEDAKVQSRASRVLRYAMPAIHVSTQHTAHESIPGGVVSYQLVAVNDGTGPAQSVEIVDTLPAQLEYLSADPLPTETAGGKMIWRLSGLAPKQKKIVVVHVRTKPGLVAGTAIQKETRLRYTDLNGNPYE